VHHEPPDREELCDLLVAEAFALRQEFRAAELDDGTGPGTPIRLRLNDQGWNLLTGDSSFDQDLEGLVAVGWLPYDADADVCDDVAEQLLEELEELAAE